MCGICGIYDLSGKPIEKELLDKMTLSLRHRGPDGEGTFKSGALGLGHRRLSIIDLEGGAQPISNEDERIQVVLNGEIYNFIELRRELEDMGHYFRTRSDTEVIVHAYEQWGKHCVNRFNGMFAFALWDSGIREIFLARDHLGIKPLYYTILGKQVLFASEIKALLQHPMCPREVDLEALIQLLTFRYVPSPNTLFRGIKKLPPGHQMTITENSISIEKYWTWVPEIRRQYNEKDLIEEYRSLVEDAVRLQLRSDVPLGLFLSSGIDSGSLLSLMSKLTCSPVRTFTIGFEDGEKTNEVDDARDIAKRFGADHEFMIVTPEDYLQYYEQYMWDLEEPVGNETAASFYFVSKITARHVKVAITGQGADELWAGYDRHLGAKLSAIYSKVPPFLLQPIAQMMIKLPGRWEKMKRALISLSEPEMLMRLVKIYSFFNAEMKQQLFSGPLKEYAIRNGYHAKDTLLHIYRDVQMFDPLTQILYIDTRTNLPDDLLMVADKMSMANSLEVRVPFLDFRIVEFVETLPPGLKLRCLTAKYLHKKALEEWLPKSVIYRKKKGFANPIENWLRKKLASFVEDYLLDPNSATSLYFDQQYIRKLLLLDRQGKEQLRRHIYLLISFEMWHRTFISNHL